MINLNTGQANNSNAFPTHTSSTANKPLKRTSTSTTALLRASQLEMHLLAYRGRLRRPLHFQLAVVAECSSNNNCCCFFGNTTCTHPTLDANISVLTP